MSSSSDRLDQMLDQYRPHYSHQPDIRELTQVLRDVTHDEKVRILKRHGTLGSAACRGHTDIIKIILSAVPQPQRLDVLLVYEFTALHSAALSSSGSSDSVETILTHLTQEQQLEIMSVRDGFGMTSADKASMYGQKETERLLRDCKQRAEKQTGTLRGLMNFHRGPINPLQQETEHGNITDVYTELNTINHLISEQARGILFNWLLKVKTIQWLNKTSPFISYLMLESRVGREEGAVAEADILESGFRAQGSHVIRHEWITACDLQDKLHTFIQAVSSECQMVFVCLMSHGAPGVLCGADGVKLPLNDLLHQLNVLPPKLPLVMLVQACQNTNTQHFSQSVELDARIQVTDANRASPPESSICPHIDLTRPHTVLLRSTVTGGYSRRGAYTEALAHQIGNADGRKSIHEMHEDAVQAMRTEFGVEEMDEIGQVPEYRDTLQGRKLVLHKAPNTDNIYVLVF